MNLNELISIDTTIPVPFDADTYESSTVFRPFNPEVKVTVQADPGTLKYGQQKDGHLWFYLKLELLDGANVGKFLQFLFNTRPYPWRKTASEAYDVAVATGTTGKLVLPADYIAAIEAATKPFKVNHDWEAKCKNDNAYYGVVYDADGKWASGNRARHAQFPVDENGKAKHVVPCPKCGEEIGAKSVVTRIYVPTGK